MHFNTDLLVSAYIPMALALASSPLVIYLPVFDKLLFVAREAICICILFDPSKSLTNKPDPVVKNNFRSSGSTKIEGTASADIKIDTKIYTYVNVNVNAARVYSLISILYTFAYLRGGEGGHLYLRSVSHIQWPPV